MIKKLEDCNWRFTQSVFHILKIRLSLLFSGLFYKVKYKDFEILVII